jgi:hypothetical protein
LPDTIVGWYIAGQLDFEYRGVVSPAIRLSATFPGEHDVGDAGGSARFSMVVPRIELCPLRFGSTKANIRPCASGAVAIIESTGINALRAGSEVRPVWVLGLSALVSVRIVGPITAFGSGGIGAPIPRYEYVFRAHDASQSNIELFSTKSIAAFAGGGLTAEFP